MKSFTNKGWRWAGRLGMAAAAWLCAAGTIRASSNFTVLHTLTTAEGMESRGGLTPGPDGFLYGTTSRGGPYPNSQQPADALGSLFRVSPATGEFAVVHAFTGQRGKDQNPDGRAPRGRLLRADDGSLYGVTEKGGTEDGGTVFRLSPAGEYAVIHSFRAAEGTEPRVGLIAGPDAAFYGTTNAKGPDGAGTVYRLAADGTVTTLHTFARSEGPVHDALALGPDGNFYGTYATGGFYNPGEGAVYRLSPAGEYTVVHRFTGQPDDGDGPFGGLLLARDGVFYGYTENGGANNRGTVYRLTPDGAFTVLHSFTAQDSIYVTGSLLQGGDGFFYGTINQGGQNNYGVVFQMTPDGSLTPLHSFDSEHGSYPDGNLFQGEDGALYGTALRHGDDGAGVVFRLAFTDPPTVSLSAPVPVVALGGGSGEFRLTLSSPQPDDLTVRYEVKKGGSFNGSGYKRLGGSAVIPAGRTGKTLRVKPKAGLDYWFNPPFPGMPPFLNKLQIRFVLVPGDNYQVGAERAAKVKIVPAGR